MSDPIRADRVELRDVDWLWPNRIPRKMITIVAGRRDAGKSLACAHIAADVSNTKYEGRYGRVLYSAFEDAYSEMTAPRLVAAGARMQNVWMDRFLIPSDFEDLEAFIRRNKIDLVVMDPFAAHLSGGISRRSDSIRRVLNPLTELIEETGTAVVMVEHVVKSISKNADPLNAIGGSSSGLVAAARMAHFFGKDPKDSDRRVLAPVKGNIVGDDVLAMAFELEVTELPELKEEVPFLLFDDEIDFDPMKLILIDQKSGPMGRPADKRAAAAEWLAKYLYRAARNGMPKAGNFAALAPGPVPQKRIFEDAKQYAINSKTLGRARQDLKVLRDPVEGGQKCTWELSDNLLAQFDRINGIEPSAQAGAPPVGEPDGPIDGDVIAGFEAMLRQEEEAEDE